MKKLLLFVLISSSIVFGQWIPLNGPVSATTNALMTVGNTVYVGTYTGMYKTTDNGTTFTAINTGIVNKFIWSLTSSGSNLFCGTLSYVYHSTDGGASWINRPTGLTSIYIYALTSNANYVFAGAYGGSNYDGGVFRTSNNGVNWTPVNTGITNENCYALAVKDNYIFAGTLGGIFRSSNNGDSWQEVDNGVLDVNIRALTVMGNDIYAATGTIGFGGVLKSTNNGNSWTPVNTGITYTNVRSFAVYGTNLFAGTPGGGVFVTTNAGTSWTPVNTGITNLSINCLTISGNYLFAGSTDNPYAYRRPLSEMVVPVELKSFTATNQNGKCYLDWTTASEINNYGFEIERKLGTNESSAWVSVGFKKGHGTTTEEQKYSFVDDILNISASQVWYRLKQTDYNGEHKYYNEVAVDNNLISAYKLEQNYPNPFNPETKISFSIPVREHVSLVVTNVLGKVVNVAVDRVVDPGVYDVNFNASDLSSGIYFYRINAGKFTQTRKMIILK